MMLRYTPQLLRNIQNVACCVALPAPAYAYASVLCRQKKRNVGTSTLEPPLPSTPWQAAPQNGLNPNVRTLRPAHGSSRGLSSRVGLPSCTSSPRTVALNGEIRSHQGFAC